MAKLEVCGATFYERNDQWLGDMELEIRTEWTVIDKECAQKIIDHLKEQFGL